MKIFQISTLQALALGYSLKEASGSDIKKVEQGTGKD